MLAYAWLAAVTPSDKRAWFSQSSQPAIIPFCIESLLINLMHSSPTKYMISIWCSYDDSCGDFII